MANFILQINNQNLSSLAKLRIENLIDDTLSAHTNTIQPHQHQDFIHPPHTILIQNFEPLRLAKKKHYVPCQSALKIQKRTGATKPQGRPFNSNLNARFLLFNNTNDLILYLLNAKDSQLGYVSPAQFKSITDGNNNLDEMQRINVENIRLEQGPDLINAPFQLKSISFEKFNDSRFGIYPELCKIFNVDELSFVKTIRNNKGKLIKFEIMSSINSKELSIDFIKKFITYPRYKSKMKIFIINKKFHQNVWFYNDLRMLIWDINNLKIENTKIMINTGILN